MKSYIGADRSSTPSNDAGLEQRKLISLEGLPELRGLLSQAPANWMEQLQSADMSWMIDATGLI